MASATALDLRIPSDVQQIEGIVAQVVRRCRECHFAGRQLSLNVPVALTEALSNAILRGQNHDLIFQLIYNLLNNAIRYNRAGGAIIVSDAYKAGEPYRLFLRDTGLGIPEADVAGIFNRFKKGTKSGSEGYGLGLSIVSTIARYHNIRLEVNSRVGEGSTFILIFPEEALV